MIAGGSYYNEVIDDARTYLEENADMYLHATENELYNDFLSADSITGNASGSYYCNSYQAKEMVLGNIEEVAEIYYENYDMEDFGMEIYNAAWETIDVKARCGVLMYVIPDLLSELQSNREVDDDEEDYDDEEDDDDET